MQYALRIQISENTIFYIGNAPIVNIIIIIVNECAWIFKYGWIYLVLFDMKIEDRYLEMVRRGIYTSLAFNAK